MASHHQSPADGSWPLEPGGKYSNLDRDIVRGDPSAPPTESEAAISAAISLKRIADRLDALDVTAFGNQLLDIAWQAGQNFRGKQ